MTTTLPDPSRRAVWSRGRRVAAFGIVGAAVALLVAAVLVDLRLRGAADPSRVTTEVTGCDLGSYGAAQVDYRLRNGDRDEHTYKIEIWVKNGNVLVGYTVSEVNDVPAGTTTTGSALIPVTPGATDATCTVAATANDGLPGHRHVP